MFTALKSFLICIDDERRDAGRLAVGLNRLSENNDKFRNRTRRDPRLLRIDNVMAADSEQDRGQ